MKTVSINGSIGYSWWEENYTTAATVREQLDGLEDGEGIEVSIDSLGGSVYEGIVIFNLLRDLAKTHPMSVRVIGVAMSMASYIMLAARSVNKDARLTVSDNSIVMIHNPWTVAVGDYRELSKVAEYLKKLAALYGSIHATISGLSIKDIREAMDAEIYYVGREIVDVGFANDFEAIGDESGAVDTAVAHERRLELVNAARTQFEKFTQSASSRVPDYADWQKVAAFLNEKPVGGQTPLDKIGLGNNVFAVYPAGLVFSPSDSRGEPSFFVNSEGGKMSPEELQVKEKSCYDAIFERGVAEGVKSALEKERLRVATHIKMGGKVGDMALAVKFIENGKLASDEDVNNAYFDAALDKSRLEARNADNPPPMNMADESSGDAVAKAFTLGAQGKTTEGKAWRE
jgi:ATP-dependent protease ClpP protease subunit